MDLERDALEYLVEQLRVKASIKQLVYRNTRKSVQYDARPGKEDHH